MNFRWYGVVAGVVAAATVTGIPVASASTNMVVRTVTPVETAPLRDIPNLNLPPVMREIVGYGNYSRQQLDQLRNRLIASGYLNPPAAKYIIPLGRMTPAMSQAPQVRDPVLQTPPVAPQPNSITPGISFDGIGVSDTPPDPVGCAPPDTNAAVGEGIVIEIVNLCDGVGVSYAKAWDTDGNALIGTTPLSGLWISNKDCTNGSGDGQVTYDQIAGRWILSQANSAFTGICVAISESSDPAGAYNLYEFVIDPNGLTDYPKLGKWPVGDSDRDAYFVTTNDFTNGGDLYVNFTALQRSNMLAGLPAKEIVVNGPSVLADGLDYSVLPADLDGQTLPPAGSPGIFVNYTSPYLFGGGTPYALAMWRMLCSWSLKTCYFTGSPHLIPVAAFNDGICDLSRACIPEPPPGQRLDSLGDRLMFRLAYRHIAGIDRQVLMTNQTVGSGSPPSDPPAGIRWYQLIAPETTLGPWTVWQQGTYLPGDGNSRWMGSIAMDKKGNSGMAFSESSSSLDPSMAFTGQNVSAALIRSNVMDAGETIAVTGSGVQKQTYNRWGDYSSIVTDPTDNCTFWAANEYISSTGSFNWSTYIASFKFDNCN